MALAVFPRHHTCVGDAAEAVMPTDRVGDDGREDAPHVRVQAVAATEQCGVLRLERVRHVVALKLLLGVEEDQRAVGTAFKIGETKCSTAANNAGPVGTSGNKVFPAQLVGGDGGSGHD